MKVHANIPGYRSHLTLISLLTLVLVGCTAQFKQVETVQRLIPRNDGRQQLAAYEWILSFNGTEFRVYPVEAAGRQITFASRGTLKLRWDGESIIVIEGLPGGFGRYESGIEASGLERWYAQAGLPVVRASCSPRREWQLSKNRRGWRSECIAENSGRLLRAIHAVEFDGVGNITSIEASIVPGGSTFALRRAL